MSARLPWLSAALLIGGAALAGFGLGDWRGMLGAIGLSMMVVAIISLGNVGHEQEDAND